MSTITTINSTDQVSASRAVINTNFSNLNTDKVEGQSASVDSEMALFSGTGGKTIKRASSTGIAKLTSGVVSVVTAPAGALVGDTDIQTLTNKTITAPTIKTYDGWHSVSDSWTYASADAPTFTITVPSGAQSLYGVGWRIKLTQTTVKYFIITAVADTVLTVYGGTDYTLANAAISSIFVSPMKAPLGFPLDPTKWTVKVTDTTDRSVSVSSNTWTQLNAADAITIPIGIWDVDYQVSGHADRTTAGTGDSAAMTLSTTTNSVTDDELTCMNGYYGSTVANSSDLTGGAAYRRKTIVLAAKTTYNLLVHMQNAGIYYVQPAQAYSGTVVLRAICAYL